MKNCYVLALLVVLVSSCTQTKKHKNTTITGEKYSTYGSYMFIGACRSSIKFVETPEEKGLGADVGAVLASNLIGAGIDALGNALAQAAADDIQKTLVTSNISGLEALYPLVDNKNKEPLMRCIQIVRGKITPTDERSDESLSKEGTLPEPISPFRYATSDIENEYAPTYVSKASYDLTDIELFIEILPIFIADTVSFTPLQLLYNGLSSGEGGGMESRDLALTIGLVPPNKEVSESNLTGRSINFGTVGADDGSLVEVSYTTKDGRVSTLLQSQWMPIAKEAITKPLTVSVLVHESREAGAFVKLLSSVFTESKEEIKTKIKEETKKAITTKEPTDEEEAIDEITKEIEQLKAKNTILDLEEKLIVECGKDDPPSVSSVTLKEITILQDKKLYNLKYPDDKYPIVQPTASCDAYQG